MVWKAIQFFVVVAPSVTAMQLLGFRVFIGVAALIVASLFASAILDDYFDAKGR